MRRAKFWKMPGPAKQRSRFGNCADGSNNVFSLESCGYDHIQARCTSYSLVDLGPCGLPVDEKPSE